MQILLGSQARIRLLGTSVAERWLLSRMAAVEVTSMSTAEREGTRASSESSQEDVFGWHGRGMVRRASRCSIGTISGNAGGCKNVSKTFSWIYSISRFSWIYVD